MQHKITKQSPGANAAAKAHMEWLKDRGVCITCGNDAGVIVHHCVGSTYKVRVGSVRVQIGNEFVLGLCICCDSIVTNGSHRAFKEVFGPYSALWSRQYADSPVKFDDLIIQGIAESGK